MIIKTERLILRPFLESDAEDVYEYLKEPAANCFACMKLNSLSESMEAMKQRISETEYYFAITLKENGKVIGEIEAYPETREQYEDKNSVPDTFSPCWMLNEKYQGKGYAFEAAKAFFDYLFQEKGARRIYAYTEDNNLSSQRLCEKLGMRKEGMFMEYISFIKNADGTPRYENTIQYAILKKEWNTEEENRTPVMEKKYIKWPFWIQIPTIATLPIILIVLNIPSNIINSNDYLLCLEMIAILCHLFHVVACLPVGII